VEGCDPARLGRRQVRKLLKVLALYHDRHVGLDRLADCLWGDDPPARPADQISVLVSRLRGVLGVDRVRRNDAGYLLAVDWLDLDALREYAAQADRRLAATAVEPPERQPQPGSRWSEDRCSQTNRMPGGPMRNARLLFCSSRACTTRPPRQPWRPATSRAPLSCPSRCSRRTPMTRRHCER
jgi:hypothetical protein